MKLAQLVWGGAVDWHLGDHLAGAATRAELDMTDLDAEAERDADTLDAEVAANQEALEAAGHWGVPTLVFNDEPFFGQDRIDLAMWRMEQAGLEKRA
ncbi:DsbA family protein [Sphingomonas asaccharolytica]|uniref:DsbA family protein n=1 Tax=Sphingomonas asaccharolytica TaxID=40681 RepID=UPI001FE07A13|nr:DsbA family protein [Sphingomonas asaccharolytica]